MAMMAHRPAPLSLFELLDELGENAWVQNLVSEETWISRSFWETLGYRATDLPLTAKMSRKLLHPDDRRLAIEEVELHLREGHHFNFEIRFCASDDEWRYLKVRGCVTEHDDSGRPSVIAGLVSDMTANISIARAEHRAKEMVATLSVRERQVLDCLLAGAASKNIAFALGLSTRTIEGYRARLLDKLGVRGTGELIQVALTGGVTRGVAGKCGMPNPIRQNLPYYS